MIKPDGWIEGIRHHPSPNYDERPAATEINLLVIHNISLPPEQFGDDWILDFFSNQLDTDAHPYFQQLKTLKVSAHFLIRRDGEIIQLVSLNQRAWHAGQSCFEGQERCNDFSIGIELEGSDNQPFEDEQYAALTQLTQNLLKHFPALNSQRITGHSDIAPHRKTDPGPFFEWQRYLDAIS